MIHKDLITCKICKHNHDGWCSVQDDKIKSDAGDECRYKGFEAKISISEILYENDRLKEALRFYAHKKHFTRTGGQYGTPYEVIWDFGEVAREALGGEG